MSSEHRHLYDFAADKQTATCERCGHVIRVELPPPWADLVADLVDPDQWRGDFDDWGDVGDTDYSAESHDSLYDGSCEQWRVADGRVELSIGSLDLAADLDDEDDLPKVMLALRAAALAFGEACNAS